MSFTLRIYRRLAQAFPPDKLAHGDQVMQAGEDAVKNITQKIAKRHGAAGLTDRGYRDPPTHRNTHAPQGIG